jgi:hypothetical protein
MSVIVLMVTIAIIFMIGWNSAELWREYKERPIEECVSVIKALRGVISNE